MHGGYQCRDKERRVEGKFPGEQSEKKPGGEGQEAAPDRAEEGEGKAAEEGDEGEAVEVLVDAQVKWIWWPVCQGHGGEEEENREADEAGKGGGDVGKVVLHHGPSLGRERRERSFELASERLPESFGLLFSGICVFGQVRGQGASGGFG